MSAFGDTVIASSLDLMVRSLILNASIHVKWLVCDNSIDSLKLTQFLYYVSLTVFVSLAVSVSVCSKTVALFLYEPFHQLAARGANCLPNPISNRKQWN